MTPSTFILSVFGFALSYVANVCNFIPYITSACCLHNFLINSYTFETLKATCNSRLGVRLGKLPVLRRIFFCRPRLAFVDGRNGLSFSLIDFYDPALTPRLHRCEAVLQLREKITFLAMSYRERCH